MRFTPLVDVSQSQLRRFLVSTNATLAEPSSSETSCSNATDSCMFTDIGASDESQPGLSYSNTAPDLVVELGAVKPQDLETVSQDEVLKPAFSDGTTSEIGIPERSMQLSEPLPLVSDTDVNDPNQPILHEYPAKKFGNETFSRKFNSLWFKQYPWLSYEANDDQCVCFPCRKFGNDNSFVYSNWKKSEKLRKHGNSEKHITAMTKWALFKANKSRNTSVLEQLSRAHKENVDCNRRYLRVIIECLMHNVQQNSPLRGHEESRDHIWEVSDTNRGNFIETLHFRCKDFPWLKNMLQSQLKAHAQWMSPGIQNERIEIVSDKVRDGLRATSGAVSNLV